MFSRDPFHREYHSRDQRQEDQPERVPCREGDQRRVVMVRAQLAPQGVDLRTGAEWPQSRQREGRGPCPRTPDQHRKDQPERGLFPEVG